MKYKTEKKNISLTYCISSFKKDFFSGNNTHYTSSETFYVKRILGFSLIYH